MAPFRSIPTGPLFPPCPLTSFRFVFRYVVNAAKAAKADKAQQLIYVSVRTLLAYRHISLTQHHLCAIVLTADGHGKSQVISFLHA